MKKLVLISLISIAIVGCVAQGRDPKLASVTGVTYKTLNNSDYLNTYTVKANVLKPMQNVKACVLQYVDNQDVQLSDTSKSFVGASSGNLYNVNSSYNSAGGDSVKYADKDLLVVKGITQYRNPQSFIPITNYVRYTLSVKQKADGISYVFSNITQAQASTGYMANSGFTPIGDWDGANPAVILSTLKSEIKNIEDCLVND
ncbi:hypothetical protein RHO13_03825 [Orbus wheelerorum]|uniref:hypothetical protein n=1 Tax=Orbus wheelerorum TaxID=3074111 RepID=UPI00370DE1A9